MVYYRKDILDKDGVAAPKTWDDYLDGRRRSTTARTSTATASRTTARASPRRRAPRATGGSSRSRPACSRARAPTTARSSTPSNMNPLFGNNEAMTKALQTVQGDDATFGPPDELNMDVGGTRGLFTTGRCALIDGLGRHRDPDARHVRPGQDRRDDHAGLDAGPRPRHRQARAPATRPPAPTPSTA